MIMQLFTTATRLAERAPTDNRDAIGLAAAAFLCIIIIAATKGKAKW